MSDEVKTVQPIVCPDCQVPCEITFMRQFVSLSMPGKVGQKAELLIRFPLARCPICQDLMATPETDSTITDAVQEFVQRTMAPAQKKIEHARMRIRRWVQLAFFWNGVLTGMFFTCAAVDLVQRAGASLDEPLAERGARPRPHLPAGVTAATKSPQRHAHQLRIA